jgi:glutamate-1-semialdehyde 2,1-aminomutase
MVAGIATLEELFQPGNYEKLERLSASLCDELKKIVPGHHVRIGSKFCTFFTNVEVVDYATAKTSDTKKYGRYFHAMMEQGIYLAPSQFEVGFMSLAHTPEDIEKTLSAARNVSRDL